MDGHWWAFSPVRQYPTHIGYSWHPSPTPEPTGVVPATPILFPYKIHIPLPVSPIVSIPQTPTVHAPLAIQLVTPPVEWAQSLWHDIRPHAHTETLCSAILANTKILLVSNAAVHPNGTGTCTWTIWANTEVWSGEGYAPGPILHMYSRLAKAYGIYTVLSFFQQYTLLYPLSLNQP